MKHVPRAVLAPLVIAGLVALAPVVGPSLSSPAYAQTEEDLSTLSKKERKERAKEARITDYLRKREEKRAHKEAERVAREQQAEQELIAAETASRQQSTPVAVASVPAEKKKPRAKRSSEPTGRNALPRNLARAQDNVSRSALGQNTMVQRYVALIDEQTASPQQLAAFGNFLAQSGMPRDAVAYYDVALALEGDDPVLWVNVGTLHRQLKDLSTAASAYERALAIDPNYSLAHYNLGVVHDQLGKYNDAMREYTIALKLNPQLGDPAYNPQAANNQRLLAVKVMLFEEQGLGIPLVEIPEGGLPR